MENLENNSRLENENGIREYQSGNFDKAVAHFEMAAQLDNRNIDARRNLADLYLQLSRYSEAVGALVSLVKDYPNDTETLITLGNLYQEAGKYDDAVAFFKRALQVDPENGAAAGALRLASRQLTPGTSPEESETGHLTEEGRLPKVSIIIPVYNQVAYTKQCIESVKKNTGIRDYEIIIADDASTDETAAYLETVRDIVRVIRNQDNLGFILNCNNAASQANGEYLVFLNNDTIPQPGWLEALLELAEADSRVGVVGAKMIWPDGRLLEAASVVFSDGTAWNFGRGDTPDRPKYNHVRPVDYVSGGGMLVRKSVWNELGGFDTRYCPAYYDDIDLCFAARKAGYQVLYTPFSRIIHFEGMTGGRDVTQGVKRYQVVNQQKFRAKWAADLALQYDNTPRNVNRASWLGEGKRILWIDHSFPLPNFNSGCLRMNHLMKTMVGLGHKVTYAALVNHDPGNYKVEMQKMGVETAWLGYEGWEFADITKKGAVIESILNALEITSKGYDIIYFSFYWVAIHFIDKIAKRLPNAIIYVDSHDIHFLRTQREAELYGDEAHILRARQTKIDELGVYSKADAVLTVTEQDKDALTGELPGKPVFLMPNVHDVVPRERDFRDRKDLLFVGGFNHTPNVDAMIYFCKEIFPKVRERLPELRLWIVGSNPPNEVKSLESESVTVTGWVDKTKPYLDSCRVSIAPIRYGAGMKGKIGEAMSHGLPVITTQVGGEGMGIINGEQALVADSVDEWVEAIERLYTNQELWNRLSENGQRLMAERYSSETMRRRAEKLLSFTSKEALHAVSMPAKTSDNRAGDTAIGKASGTEKKKNILVIDPFLPLFDRAAGSLHLFNILKVLRELDFNVTFLAINGVFQERYVPYLEEMGIETYAGDHDGMSFQGYESSYRRIDYAKFFREKNFDFAIIDFWNVAAYYIPLIRKFSPFTTIIVDTEDVHFVRELREARVKDDQELMKRAMENKKNELLVYSAADVLWVVTQDDKQAILNELNTVKVEIRPVIHELPKVNHSFDERNGILFVGNFSHRPNLDAIQFFVREVMPIVRKTIPDIRLHVVGNDPRNSVAPLASENVIVEGYVEDLSECYNNSRVSVAPLRYGAGLKGKVVESLSYGVPVVTTSVGVEGTGLRDGSEVLIADNPADIAEKIILACTDKELWTKLSVQGRMVMEKKWSFEAGRENLEVLLSQDRLTPRSWANKLISIVILTYNQLEYTKLTIDSIRRNTKLPYELIVVDNASSDGTVEYLKSQKDIHAIFNEENLGFPAGCNEGIEASTGDYILLLNNDVIVPKEWLEGLVECAQSSPRIGIVGPMSNRISGYQLEQKVGYRKVSQVQDFAAKYRRKNRKRWIEVPRVAGFCMLIKRDLIDRIGGLDTAFGMGNCEDDDFCVRARLAGYGTVVAGDVFIHHFGSVSFGKDGLEKYKEFIRVNELVFKEKWGVTPLEWWREGKQITKSSGLFVPLKPVETEKTLVAPQPPTNVDVAESVQQNATGKTILEDGETDSRSDSDENISGDLTSAYHHARQLAMDGDLEEAIQSFETLLEDNPAHSGALNDLGALYFQKGLKDKALRLFKESVESSPLNFDALRNLADLYVDSGRIDEALIVLKDILTKKPNDQESLQKIGALCNALGRTEDAAFFLARINEA